jgi:hypothetical protein
MSDVPPNEPAASTEVQDSTAEAKPEAKGDASSVEEGQIVSPSKPMAKHELEYEWVLWFDNPGGRQNVSGYGQSLRMVYSFKTVEDFWCLFNNIKPPSMFQPNVTYYLFKKGIEPKWECPANASGGSWSANIPAPKNPEAKRRLDEWWLHSIMACIGRCRAAAGTGDIWCSRSAVIMYQALVNTAYVEHWLCSAAYAWVAVTIRAALSQRAASSKLLSRRELHHQSCTDIRHVCMGCCGRSVHIQAPLHHHLVAR